MYLGLPQNQLCIRPISFSNVFKGCLERTQHSIYTLSPSLLECIWCSPEYGCSEGGPHHPVFCVCDEVFASFAVWWGFWQGCGNVRLCALPDALVFKKDIVYVPCSFSWSCYMSMTVGASHITLETDVNISRVWSLHPLVNPQILVCLDFLIMQEENVSFIVDFFFFSN